MPAAPPSAIVDAAAVGPTSASFSPLYQQIKMLIVRSLQGGEWRPGEAIPSEMDLAQRYRVSQGTVRKAIDTLADENLVVRRQGRGTFVATHAEQHIQYRFLRLTPDDASAAGRLQRRVIDCRRQRATVEMARLLQLKTGDPVVQLRRVLELPAEPIVFDDIWLPGLLFKGLTAERLNETSSPLYGIFERDFGVRMIRAEEKLSAVAAADVAAQWLAVAPGTPLLSVERLSFTYGDRPVELRRGLYRTETYHYRNELS